MNGHMRPSMNSAAYHRILRCVSARPQAEFIELCYACCREEEEVPLEG